MNYVTGLQYPTDRTSSAAVVVSGFGTMPLGILSMRMATSVQI